MRKIMASATRKMRQPAIKPEVIAHRGLRDRYPENSVPAFLAALDAGVDAIELDVHATRDGVVVVHHDFTLSGNDGSAFRGRAISTIDFNELSVYEIAPGVGVPSLETVLRAVAGRAKVYIEIKARNIEALVASVLDLVTEATGKCAVHSFDHRIIRSFNALAPHVPTGILLVGYPVDVPSLLRAAHARDLWQVCDFIDGELISSVHNMGGRVVGWTCNESSDWTRLRALGVDAVCTDRSADLVEWLGGK